MSYNKSLEKALKEKESKTIKKLFKDLSKELSNNKIVLYQCRYCGRFSINKRLWFKTYEKQLIRHVTKIFRKSCFKHMFRDNCEDILNNLKIRVGDGSIIIIYQTLDINIETVIGFIVKPATCNACSLKRSSYYEAIIQLRAKTNNTLQQIMNRIIKILKQKSTHISKTISYNKGVDLYVNKSKTALSLTKIFKNYDIKKSRTLIGVKDGKRSYRVTVLIREK